MRKLAAESGSGRAVQLVYGDENGRLKMDSEAIEAIQQLKGPVVVVSLYGKSRHGKSFIWNQLLSRSLGFQVESVHRPCAGDLWMWIEPVKRIAEDDTEYHLVLLDVEGADTDGLSDKSSTQTFSLAVLLSSVFIYCASDSVNDIALDNISLLMEITKHEHEGAAINKTVSGLGQFSPLFVRLLMDSNSNIVEDNLRVTSSDHLDSAQNRGAYRGKDATTKNKIHESLCALFPNQECVTLACGMINEAGSQLLEQTSLGKLRPQFLSSIDALVKFVYERTRPKQIGGTTMTGPLIAGFAKSFLENLNSGVVPRISSSWQSVEELECRRAYDTATDVYMSSLERMEAPEDLLLMEAHNKAVLKAMAAFDRSAIGKRGVRQKYETDLHSFLRKAFEDHKRVACMEADSRCCNAIDNMGRKLRTISCSHAAHMDGVIKVLDTLVVEYEASIHGPRKWQKLSAFLRKSLQDILVHRGQNHAAKLLSENSNLTSQCRSMESSINLLKKQLEGCENMKNEYQKRYKDAIDDMNKISDQYKSRIHDLESRCSSAKDQYSNLMETLEFTRQEDLEWRRKYEVILNEKRASDAETLITRCNGSIDWKIKYENCVREAKAASEKVIAVEERLKEASANEDTIRAEFSRVLDDKEKIINDKAAELANLEQQLATMRSVLKSAELKMEKCSMELADLMPQVSVLNEKYESVKSQAELFETETVVLRKEKAEIEQKYISCSEKLEKVGLRLNMAEAEAATVKDLVSSMRAEEDAARNKVIELQRSLQERCTEIKRANGCIEDLERQNKELVALLDTRMREKEEEIAALQRIVSAQKENIGDTRVNLRMEDYFMVSGEVAQGSYPQTPHMKRLKVEATTCSGTGFVQETDAAEEDTATQESGRTYIAMTPRKCTTPGAGASSATGTDHSKYTMKTLRSEIMRHGFEAELVRLKNPRKRDLVELYERCILRK